MLPVIEMFASIQGEGVFSGVPSFFVRVSGCNLRCSFKGSICDTPYASFDPEKSPYKTMDDLVGAFMDMASKYPKVNHIVITGGEPMLYRDEVAEFLKRVNPPITNVDEKTAYPKYTVTVESNGTLPVIEEYLVDLYSISPKLSTSVGNAGGRLTPEQVAHHDRTRWNPTNLVDIAMHAPLQLKFVYSDKESLEEIDKLIDACHEEYIKNYPEDYADGYMLNMNDYIMLMPEGITNEQLQRTREECVNICLERGWQYTDRIQIIIWGDKRGV